MVLVSGAVAVEPHGFGDGTGKFKMLYDVRQRPQALLLHDTVYLVYNGDAKATGNHKGDARPMFVTYNLKERSFSKPVKLGKRSTDHHDSPVIWADAADHLHILYGCHRSAGTHLVSAQPVRAGSKTVKFVEGAQIAESLSYPTVYQVHGNRQAIYYRTDGHTSSWTYRVSADNGKTWEGPAKDVTDLDLKAYPEWSSYQTKLPSPDGRFLHVVYTDYDDVKSNDPKRLFNPRYQQVVTNEWKYNLSYVKIDLASHKVYNADGKVLETPIHLDYSREHCRIWNTEGRGAGIPPAMALDGDGEPTFLHVLSGDDIKTHRYYYVRRKDGKWLQTPICASNHQWNSGYLRHDAAGGTIHAYVIVGHGYLDTGGYMDRHGGGRVEEWVSSDAGTTWRREREIASLRAAGGWRFNNVQPVVRPDGSFVDGMLLFYGWKDRFVPRAAAFLVHEESP
jgi:hypothetical protein